MYPIYIYILLTLAGIDVHESIIPDTPKGSLSTLKLVDMFFCDKAIVIGDPHIITLDGLKYTFNEKREFTLIETAGERFTLQARMVAATDGSGNAVTATVFSAIVAKQNGSDKVQFGLSRRGLDALVNGERIDLTDVPRQEFSNVTVADIGNDTFSAQFSGGAYVEVRVENDIISVLLVNLPDSLQGATRGLMENFNGNTSDSKVRSNRHRSYGRGPHSSILQEGHLQSMILVEKLYYH